MRRLPAGAPILTAADMREAEQRLFDSGVSQDALMERAAAAVARETARLAAGRPILVLAGPGDNGGDAYAAARLLGEAGLTVSVAALGEPKAGAAARMAARWRGPVTTLADAPRYPVVVDGLLGIGTVRPFAPEIADAVVTLTDPAALRIAIDLPSGTDANTGRGGLDADVTIALGALKPGNVLADGVGGGHVLLDAIGIAAASRWTTLAPPVPAPLRHDVNKFTRGMVVVIGGAMPGAEWLAASAALHGGAGYVVLAGFDVAPGAPHALVRKSLASVRDLERLLNDERIDAVVVGPGLGRDDRARALLDAAVSCRHDLVLDGDALTLLGRDVGARIAPERRRVYLTPHAGEFARMFDSSDNKISETVAAAAQSGACVIHKGPDTVIGSPEGRAIVAGGSTPWLATAGSGDVLAGLLAARIACGDPPSDAASAAVWLHARAAATAGVAFTADDLVRAVPRALAQVRPW